ncbi:acidic tetraheme cytochrome c3 TmcA [Desulfobacter curvatus]|uniref:acidic tetraheme cytochrome c3 TmcA n=1 Tax=Desulfobacter curvatus TaxID=2290 RepID=UPI0012F84855|nr:cytochrome c3 family protein [Desulfobacter curvatus]
MKIKILIIALMLFACSGISMVHIKRAVAVEDIVRMDTSAFGRLRRPAAVFDHNSHNEAAQIDDCAVCHHVWENGKLVPEESSEDTSCSECHGLIAGPHNPMTLTNAFHIQCRSCHVKKGKGPLLCAECHQKK